MEAGPGQWQRAWREVHMAGVFARELRSLSDEWIMEDETGEMPRMVPRLHPEQHGE